MKKLVRENKEMRQIVVIGNREEIYEFCPEDELQRGRITQTPKPAATSNGSGEL